MMKVQQLMTRPVRWCLPSDPLDVPARLMWEGDCGSVPVCVADAAGVPHVIGMITDRDVAMGAYTQGRPLREIDVLTAMSHTAVTCRPTDGVGEALAMMEAHRVRRLPVVEAEERLVGMLSLSDVAQATAALAARAKRSDDVRADALGTALRSISTPRAARQIVAA